MNSFFNLEGPLISALDKFGRIVICNVLWLLCCLPIITIGASTTAFYYGMAKTIRHERSSAPKEFFKCFKRVLKNSLVPTILFVVALAVLIVDALVWSAKNTGVGLISSHLCVILAVILVCVGIYFVAVQSRFLYSTKELIKFSAFLAMKHLPYTILMLLMAVLAIFLTAMFPVFGIFVPGIACMGISYFMENVFKKYIPKPEEGEEVWYDE